MRFVAIKSVEQQASQARAVARAAHTQLMNCVRSQLAELGIMAAAGRRGFAELTALLAAEDAWIPAALSLALRLLVQQIEALRAAIAALERQITTARRNAWNPIRVTHRGQRSADRIQQAGYMTAPDHMPPPPENPCSTGAVHT